MHNELVSNPSKVEKFYGRIFQKIYFLDFFSFCMSKFHMKKVPPMNAFKFLDFNFSSQNEKKRSH